MSLVMEYPPLTVPEGQWYEPTRWEPRLPVARAAELARDPYWALIAQAAAEAQGGQSSQIAVSKLHSRRVPGEELATRRADSRREAFDDRRAVT